MAQERRAATMQLSGNDYAKVAERLKLFRTDWPHSKHESAYEYDVDGSATFTVWLWKEKDELLELIKAGITDKDTLRSSADANGNAKGQVGEKQKDFEKLESIALGRALANLGYLASGEIASFEEMEEYEKFREQQQAEAVQEVLAAIGKTTSNLELNKLLKEHSFALKDPEVVKAAKAQQATFKKEVKEKQ
jgi:hypothetical protein